MPLFRRVAKPEPEPAGAKRDPVVAGPADIDLADAVLARFEQAVGDSDALYDAFAAISRAGGGIGTFEEQLKRGLRDSFEDRFPRPWYWLVAVGAAAQRAGNHLLVARICLFTEMWVNTYLPRMNPAGSLDSGLGSPPDRPRAEIATLGLDAVSHLQSDQVVAGNQTGTTRARDVRLACAHALDTLAQHQNAGVPHEVLARARRIIETGDDAPSGEEASKEITALVLAGNLQEALDRGEHHLIECRETRGDADPATIRAAAALGLAQLRAGRLYDVVATLQPIHPVAVRVLGDGDASALQIAANLAAALRETERAGMAVPLLDGALGASQRALGSDDATTLALRSELAATYTVLGNHTEAIAMHQQLFADRTRVLGPHHPDTLTSASFLGQAYHAAGDLDRAIAQYESLTAASREALGAEHPDTLSSQQDLAGAYASADRPDEAIALYEATLEARRRVLGATHLHTLNTMNSLAVAYTQAGRDQQALALLEQAAALCAESLTPDHPIATNIATSLTMARLMAANPSATPSADPRPAAGQERAQLRQVASFKSPGKGLGFGLAWSPSGDRMAVAGFDDSVVVFDIGTGGQVLQTPRRGTVPCVSWSLDGRTLACGTSQRTVHLFAADTGQELRQAAGHRDEIRSIAYSPDGRFIATSANDGQLYIWTATDLSIVTTIVAHAGRARSAAWAPNSTNLASSGQDNTVRIWQVGTWSLDRALNVHTSEVSSVAYSPDGQFLASGSLDSTIRIWDLRTQRYRHVLDADQWWVIDLAFSPDSHLLAALSNEEVLVFDLRTGDTIATTRPPFGTQSISWRPNGRHIATVGHEATIWELPT